MTAQRSMAVGRLRRVALVGVIVAAAGCGDPGYYPDLDLHPPSTEKERAAARVAVNFATLVQRGQAPEACDLARSAASRSLRCSRTPRIPGALGIPSGQRPHVIDVTPAKVSGAIRLGIVPGRLVLAVEVDPSGHVVYVANYAYA